jgi:hypothetical protein
MPKQPEEALDLDFDLDIDLNFDIDPEEAPAPAAAGDLMAGYKYTGSAEVDSAAECSAVLTGFKARAKAESARRQKATDSEYWFCMCFQSRAQVEEFLRKTKWAPEASKYVDGLTVAKKLGVEITPETPVSGRVSIDAKLANLAVEF